MTLRGKAIMEGIAIGILRLLPAEARLAVPNEKEGSAEEKRARFYQIRENVAAEYDALAGRARDQVGAAEAEIFSTHRLMVLDGDLEDAVLEGIEKGKGLADSIREAGEGLAAMLSSMEDGYLRARAADAKEVSERLVGELQGRQEHLLSMEVPTVLAADDITPEQLIRADRSQLMGFFTAAGASGSHTAILARSLSLPSAVATGALPPKELDGETVIVDGFTGEIIISPDTQTLALYCEKQAAYKAERKQEESYRGLPGRTKDGYEVQIFCNIGRGEEVAAVLQNDGDGIGLFRSEFLYLESEDYPTEEAQFRIYRRLLEDMGGRPVVIRTMDVGADKQVDYFRIGEEDNPALGYRSIRICMDRPEILHTQLRALYRASAYGNLSILIPMIISPAELRWVWEQASAVKDELRRAGIAFDPAVKMGIMIETPAAALLSDLLAKKADFFSIGTNDLTQYTLAVDRQNQRIDRLYDPRHPAILRMIATVTENAHREGKKVCVCGELARDSQLTPFLLAVGVDSLSVSPPYVLRIRRAIRECDRSEVKRDEFLKLDRS